MDAQTRWAVEQIQRYLKEGNPEAVVEIGETLLAREGDDLDVLLMTGFCLGMGYEQLQRWDRALHWFEQCLALDPSNPLLAAACGRVLMKMGQLKDAATIFRRLAAKFPDRADYHQAAGAALLQTADLRGALRHLIRARELAPDNPYVLNDLGQAYLLDGDFETALEAFRQAIRQIAPEDVDLAREIRESIEEVRAALILQERAAGPLDSASVSVLTLEGIPAPDASAAVGDPGDAQQFYATCEVRAALLDGMIEKQCRPRQVLAALHLWSDFLETLSPAERERTQRRPQLWAAAGVYTIGRLDGEPWATQQNVAQDMRVSPGALSRRFVRLKQALVIEIGDPRYSTRGSSRRDKLIEQIHQGRGDPDWLLL